MNQIKTVIFLLFLLVTKNSSVNIHFTKKFNEVNKFNLDSDPILIELNDKVLNG